VLSESHRPDGLDLGLWERFVEYRAARGRLEVAVREQTAQVRQVSLALLVALGKELKCSATGEHGRVQLMVMKCAGKL
jgi:hypothetical protein